MSRSIGLFIMCAMFLALPPALSAAEMFVYFGTNIAGKGFSLARFDTETGALSKPQFLLDAKEPAYFIIDPTGKHLYTCNAGTPGDITAYEIDRKTGQLNLMNQKSAGGVNPTYVMLDKTGKFILHSNYTGGNIGVLAVQPDGSLGERTSLINHTGSSIHPQRQTKPFPHSILADATNRYALVPDLGVDKLFVYRFNEKDGTLTPNDPPSVSVKPGAGPRHSRFHPNGKLLYAICELNSTIAGYNWDAAKGSLTEFQTISTLPEGYTETSTCAEIDVHPSGKFLYGTNRGHDSMAVFAIDQTSGKLTLIQHIPTKGRSPRNFSFDPTGKWIICTNHAGNNAVVFRVDENSGRLTQVGEPVELLSPFCPRFLPVVP